MGENKLLDCSTSKKEDESRWVCFARSSIISTILTLICCLIGAVYIYYVDMVITNTSEGSNENIPFPTITNNFFSKLYTAESTNGGGSCSSNIKKNINLNLQFTSFPYNLPKKEKEVSFENWFANTIFRNTSINNKILNGAFNGLAGVGHSKFINLLYLIFGWLITAIFLVISCASNSVLLLPLYSIIKALGDPGLFTAGWANVLIGIIIFITGFYPIILITSSLLYYPMKLFFYLTLIPYITNHKAMIDIFKCNSTVIAYLLTFGIIISGWSHLSLTVASIMTGVWFLLLSKDILHNLTSTVNS